MIKFKKIFIGFVLLLCVLPQISFADTASELQKQINDTNNQIKKLDEEIRKYQNQINQTSQQSNKLKNIITELTLTRSKLLKERQVIEKKITATNSAIKTIVIDIENQESVISLSRRALASLIKDINYTDKKEPIELLLTKESVSDLSKQYNHTLSLNEKIHGKIRELQGKVRLLDTTKIKKEVEQKSLNDLKNNLTQKTLAIEITKKEKDTLLTETKNQESEYKKLLAEREKQKNAFEKSLEDYESQLKFILNPKSLPGKGALSWPVENVYITSSFGPRWGRFHYGTDFRASVGTKVMAMAQGVVLGTGDTDIACKGASFGKWVFIKYNNGLSSTYGHLSSIQATVGQKVVAGDTVGLSGNTGSSTGPHLHVGVYASDGVNVDTVPSKSCNGKIFTQPIAAINAYLDPALYLPKMLAGMMKK